MYQNRRRNTLNFPKSSVLPLTTTLNAHNHLRIGGCDVPKLVERFGSPLYVFDEADLLSRARAYREEFETRHLNTQVAYACKAFINAGLASILAQQGLGFDVVSGGEIAALQLAKVDPATVYFHGNNKSPEELRQALRWEIGYIVVDSFHELRLLDRIAGEIGRTQPILIRLSPGIDPHTHIYTTTGILDSKFGFSIETRQAEEAVHQAVKARNLELQGVHFHLGSPIFEVEPYIAAIRAVLEFTSQMRKEGLNTQLFSPGGGFAVAYTEDQTPPTVAQYAEAIVGTLHSTSKDLGMELPRLVIEPGRAIVGPSCVALYTVGSRKDISGVRSYVSVDGGMGDNVRTALYDARYEVLAATKMKDELTEKVTIAGKFCESGDILARDVDLPALEPGDILAVPTSGAYNLSLASNYNMTPRPAIIIVSDGQARLLRRRENFEDLMRTDVL